MMVMPGRPAWHRKEGHSVQPPVSYFLETVVCCRLSKALHPHKQSQTHKINDNKMKGLSSVVLLSVLLFAPCCLCVRDTKFYDVLGIAPDADDRTLKKAYKKQAL